MSTTIDANFDREVFAPSSRSPMSAMRITVEEMPDRSYSFLRTARGMNLQERPDWATKLDEHFHGNHKIDEGRAFHGRKRCDRVGLARGFAVREGL